MKVEVLYFDGCPHHPEAVQLVREVLEQTGIRADLVEVAVNDAAQAERLKFVGSPTVRVNGEDIEPGATERTGYALSCRMYGSSGVPPRELLLAALEGG